MATDRHNEDDSRSLATVITQIDCREPVDANTVCATCGMTLVEPPFKDSDYFDVIMTTRMPHKVGTIVVVQTHQKIKKGTCIACFRSKDCMVYASASPVPGRQIIASTHGVLRSPQGVQLTPENQATLDPEGI